jgi:DNA-binding NtrC family response regulator
MTSRPIIVVDDEDYALVAVKTALLSFKYQNVITCGTAEELWQTIEKQGASLVLLDLIMPHVSGEEILKKIKEDYPDIQVIMTTGVDDLETAVRCMRNGAFDYLVKPIERDQLRISVRKAFEFQELERCNEALSVSLLNNELHIPEAFTPIKTTDSSMSAIFRYIEAVSPSSHTILITGETGTGKELVAQAIHTASKRSGEFIPVNVAGLDDSVLADTLFGHEKGAFTGAQSLRKGLVERAGNGTLFLDEIGDLSIPSQIKLLRLLQENEYLPLGTDRAKRSSCRIIAATSRPVLDLKDNDNFRNDLFYRLKTHHIHIPALRDRKGDIPVLVQLFLEDAAKELGKNTPTPPKEIYGLLSTWHFPGNVRELRAIIYDAVANHTGKVMSLSSIKAALGMNTPNTNNNEVTSQQNLKMGFPDPLPTFKEAEALLLDEALKRAKGNRALAANLLGVTRSAITQRLNKSPRT